jgi:hypothetical protein
MRKGPRCRLRSVEVVVASFKKSYLRRVLEAADRKSRLRFRRRLVAVSHISVLDACAPVAS